MQYSVLKKCLPVIQSFLETFRSSHFTLSLSFIKVFGFRESVLSPSYLDSIGVVTELKLGSLLFWFYLCFTNN